VGEIAGVLMLPFDLKIRHTMPREKMAGKCVFEERDV
jgi:hypothetical protein